MSFDALIQKVSQAEKVLEAREREVAVDWQQFQVSWRAAWTPGRIVIAGLVSGFLVGRAKPLRNVSGGGVLQMLSALSGLLASGSAKVAADQAERTADSLQADVQSAPESAPESALEPTPDLFATGSTSEPKIRTGTGWS